DGIRDRTVTGVQTCALPILAGAPPRARPAAGDRATGSGRGPIRRAPAVVAQPRTDRRGGFRAPSAPAARGGPARPTAARRRPAEIGRASCRERGQRPTAETP